MGSRSAIALLVAILAGCSPDVSCTERDVSALWVPTNTTVATPIYNQCNAMVGWRLDLDANPPNSMISWVVANHEPVTVGGPQYVSADIDLGDPAVRRSVAIERGTSVYAEASPTTTQVATSATVIPGPLLRKFTIQVPVGSAYRGEIRNFK